jgi:hypothetical protein
MNTVSFIVIHPVEPETSDFYNLIEARNYAEVILTSLIVEHPQAEVPILELDTDTFQLIRVHKVYGRMQLTLKTHSNGDHK